MPLAFSHWSESSGRALAFEPEGASADEAIAWDTMTWGQYQFTFAPQVDRYKWLECRHMVNISHRWNRDKTDDLQFAFFNGVGWESWENIWGIWNGITPRDAEATRRVVMIERGVSPAHIIIWGHSLGSGPAVVLESEHPVAAPVLFGAFTSIPAAAQDTYPYLPVKWNASIRFASIDLMHKVNVPVLIAHSATDTLIPLHHAQRLFAAANEPKRLLVLHGALYGRLPMARASWCDD